MTWLDCSDDSRAETVHSAAMEAVLNRLRSESTQDTITELGKLASGLLQIQNDLVNSLDTVIGDYLSHHHSKRQA